MKRLLLSLFVIIVALSSANAGEVTFDLTDPAAFGYAVPETSKGTDLANGTLTVGNVVITSDKKHDTTDNRFWGTANGVEGLRCYKPSTLTFSTNNGEVITAITFEGVTITPAVLTFDSGEYDKPTWTGSASKVVLTFGGTAKISSIVVSTAGQAASVADPTFSLATGTYYVAKNVEITCATEGAIIHYTTNGDEPTSASAVYNAPIKVESTTTIKAMASKGSDNSTVVSATYTIGETTPVKDIADFFTTNRGIVHVFTNPVSVLYQSGLYLFVQDESAAMQIYGDVGRTYKNGDIIPAGIIGEGDVFGGELQFRVVEPETFAAPEEGPVIAPTVVKIDAIDDYLFDKLIQVNDAIVNFEDGKTLTDGTGTINLYARFNEVTLPTDDKSYNVTAIVSRYNGNFQLFPISFTLTTGIANVDNAASKVVAGYNVINVNAAEDTQVTVVNSVGQALVNKTVSAGTNAIPVSAGFYLVKVGDVVAKVVVR